MKTHHPSLLDRSFHIRTCHVVGYGIVRVASCALVLLSFVLLSDCGGGGGGGNTYVPPPAPPPLGSAVSAVYPATVVTGHDQTTISVLGSGFLTGAVASINGYPMPTTVLSSGKLRVTFNGYNFTVPGVASVTVANPTNLGDPTPASLTFAPPNYAVRKVRVSASALAWNPSAHRFYFLVPSTASANPNSIGVLDPATDAITYVPIPGGAPKSMSLSDDNQYLYVYSDQESLVQRLSVSSLALDISFDAPGAVRDLKPAPAASRTIALSIHHSLAPGTPSSAVLVYDDATPRPTSVPWATGSVSVVSPDLAWGDDATRLFGREVDSGAAVDYMSVDASGVTATLSHGQPTYLGSRGITYDRATRMLYLTNGTAGVQIVDPATDQWAGLIDAEGLTLADPGTGKLFQLRATNGSSPFQQQATITAFDINTRNFIESIAFDDNPDVFTRLIRFESDGLAYLTPDGISLVTGAFVTGRPAAVSGGVDGPAVSTVGGQRVVAVDAFADAIVADPVRGTLYIAEGGFDRQRPNSVAAIDPQSGAVTTIAAVNSDPLSLAVSDDGQFLYVGNRGAGAVEQFALPTLTRTFQRFLGWKDPFPLQGRGAFIPMELAVAPGLPHTVAVQMATIDFIDPMVGGGISILDDDVPRSSTLVEVGAGTPRDSIQWGSSPDTLYAEDNETTGYEFFWMSVDGAGIRSSGSATNAVRTLIDPAHIVPARMHYDPVTRLMYFDDGLIINPVDGSRVGEFGRFAYGVAAVDGLLNRAFFLLPRNGGGTMIQSFDLQSRLLVGTLELPYVNALATRLVRWGSNGLAFNDSNGEVWIVSGSFVH
jgi:hypothetical protein